MKTIIFLITIIFSFSYCYSQNSCEQIIRVEIIEKIKKYPSNELVAYQDTVNGGFGLMHLKTKRKLTKPLFMEPAFFKPFLRATIHKRKGYCEIQVPGSSHNYESINSKEHKDDIIRENGSDETPIIKKKNIRDYIKDDIKGFEVDKKNRITYFNSKFYDSENKKRTLLSVFHLKGKYYAINETKNYYYQIIDQKGNIMPGFENLIQYPRVKFSYLGDDDLWFLIKIGKWGYKLKSLLKQKLLPETFSKPLNWNSNGHTVGYVVMDVVDEKYVYYHNGEKKWDEPMIERTGILDIATMKWKIKPSEKNDIQYLLYSSLEKLSKEYENDDRSLNTWVEIPKNQILENRKKADVYIISHKYQIYDLNLNLLEPRKEID